MWNADYFTDQFKDDIKGLKDGPPRVEVILVDGERLAVHGIHGIHPGTIAFLIYPQDGSSLPEYSQDDQAAGMPRYRAECVVVAYQHIKQVRLSNEDKATKRPFGFSPS